MSLNDKIIIFRRWTTLSTLFNYFFYLISTLPTFVVYLSLLAAFSSIYPLVGIHISLPQRSIKLSRKSPQFFQFNFKQGNKSFLAEIPVRWIFWLVRASNHHLLGTKIQHASSCSSDGCLPEIFITCFKKYIFNKQIPLLILIYYG